MSINAARLRLRDAEEALRAEIAKTHPVGSRLQWDKRGHLQEGVVIGLNNFGDPRIHVRNDVTVKEYWIELYDIYGTAE